MNIIKSIALPVLFLLSSTATYAATITDVSSDAFKYVNTDNTLVSDLFTNSGFSSSVSEAWLWSGGSTNIAGEGQIFENNLNNFFDNNGQAASDFDFNTAVKVSSGFEYPIAGPIGGILLKQSTASLLVLFSSPVSNLYWNTEFTGGNSGGLGNDPSKISHYLVIDGTISQVPVPAALWLFAPALLGFLGLRRKQR
jgi:hypothetical protein